MPEDERRGSLSRTDAPVHTAPSVDTGPGPVRHSRPLTAAELHLELEKEQEAVVNKLSRELATLRQQTASVVSTSSSTSTGAQENPEHAGQAALGPTSLTSDRPRSLSNLSSRSAGLGGSSTTNPIRTTAARDQPAGPQRTPSSRLDSTVPRQHHVPASPTSPSEGYVGEGVSRLSLSQGPTASGSIPAGSPLRRPSDTRPPHRTGSGGSSRFEEVAQQRAELENVRRENEALRRRVKELERRLSAGGRHSDAE